MTDYGTPPGFTPPGAVPTTPAAPPVKAGKRGKKNKPSGTPTRQSSNLVKWLSIVLAALAGLFIVLFLTGSTKQTFVIRANAPIPALVAVSADNLEAVPLPESAIEPDTFLGATAEEAIQAATDYMTGKWLVYPIGANQQLRTNAFSTIGELATPLAPEERLISVSAKAAKSVAGSVRPGDRIDVFVSTQEGLSGLLAENIEVVGVSVAPQDFDSLAQAQLDNKDVTLSESVPAEPIPGTYLLRVKATDVQRFIAADTGGTISIALRAPNGVDAGAARPLTVTEAMCLPGSTIPSCGQLVVPPVTGDQPAPAATPLAGTTPAPAPSDSATPSPSEGQ